MTSIDAFHPGARPASQRDVVFEQHGLPLLFAAVAIESFGVPVPGETALIAFALVPSCDGQRRERHSSEAA